MEYIIEICKIEELQNLKCIADIEKILVKAHRMINQGGVVVLKRQNPDGTSYRVEEISTEKDLIEYRNNTLKYL